MAEYYIKLWLDLDEINENEEILKYQKNASDILDKFLLKNNIEITFDLLFESETIMNHYYEVLRGKIKTNIEKDSLKGKLEQLRRTIDLCNEISIEEIEK